MKTFMHMRIIKAALAAILKRVSTTALKDEIERRGYAVIWRREM